MWEKHLSRSYSDIVKWYKSEGVDANNKQLWNIAKHISKKISKMDKAAKKYAKNQKKYGGD